MSFGGKILCGKCTGTNDAKKWGKTRGWREIWELVFWKWWERREKVSRMCRDRKSILWNTQVRNEAKLSLSLSVFFPVSLSSVCDGDLCIGEGKSFHFLGDFLNFLRFCVTDFGFGFLGLFLEFWVIFVWFLKTFVLFLLIFMRFLPSVWDFCVIFANFCRLLCDFC